jgi:hypothetical protein
MVAPPRPLLRPEYRPLSRMKRCPPQDQPSPCRIPESPDIGYSPAQSVPVSARQSWAAEPSGAGGPPGADVTGRADMQRRRGCENRQTCCEPFHARLDAAEHSKNTVSCESFPSVSSTVRYGVPCCIPLQTVLYGGPPFLSDRREPWRARECPDEQKLGMRAWQQRESHGPWATANWSLLILQLSVMRCRRSERIVAQITLLAC